MSFLDDYAKEEESNDIVELQKSLKRAHQKISSIKKSREDLVQAVYEATRDGFMLAKSAPPPRPRPDKRRKRAEVALLHMSDWQTGKVTPDYNSDVMSARVNKYIEKVSLITDIQRADHPVRDVVIMFGGDLVEGVDIFPGQAWEVDKTLFEQLEIVVKKVDQVVEWALGFFEHVHVVFEPGNHGRLGGRRGATPKGDNSDHMVGWFVSWHWKDEKRLTWEMRDHWFQKVVYGNYRAMLIHGDEVRGFGGNVPAQALLRKGTAWAAGAAQWEFTDLWVGHYHQSMLLTMPNGGIIRMTGSTESSNQYASEFVGAVSRPSQRLAFLDPDKGQVTSDHIIWLD